MVRKLLKSKLRSRDRRAVARPAIYIGDTSELLLSQLRKLKLLRILNELRNQSMQSELLRFLFTL